MCESVLEKMMTNMAFKNPYLAALEWHIAHGADEGISDTPVDRTRAPVLNSPAMDNSAPKSIAPAPMVATATLVGTPDIVAKAQKLAKSCQNLADLSAAIAGFDDFPLKKTAANMVFGDGHSNARVMVIGEAPAVEEDKTGKAFVGESGVLLDKILASIGLSRHNEDVHMTAYVTYLLNWRPPGNRSASQQEIDISLPFLERHIALVQPKFMILLGGTPAKALLQNGSAITKLRGKFHDYSCEKNDDQHGACVIPTIITYHPTNLLNTPALKKPVWEDMLMLAERLKQ